VAAVKGLGAAITQEPKPRGDSRWPSSNAGSLRGFRDRYIGVHRMQVELLFRLITVFVSMCYTCWLSYVLSATMDLSKPALRANNSNRPVPKPTTQIDGA
jgi:hypothetical protein